MPAKIGSIFVQLGLDTATFQKRLTRASSRLQRSVKKMRRGLRSLAKPITLVTGLLGVLGGFSFGTMIRSTLEGVDALAKMSDTLSISTEALGGYRLAANLAGASNADLEKGIGKLNRNIGDVVSGLATQSSAVNKAFGVIGVSAQQLQALGPEKAFEKVVDEISKIPDAAGRTSAAMALLGRSGQNLQVLINGGAEGLRKAREEADALGLSINRVDAAKIEEANDAITRMKAAFAGFANQLTIQLAPLLKSLADGITNLAKESGGWGDIIERVINFSVAGFGFMGDAILGLRVAFFSVRAAIHKVIEVVATLLSKFSDLAAFVLGKISDIVKGLKAMAAGAATAFESVVNTVGNFIVGMANTVLAKVADLVEKGIQTIIDGVNPLSKIPGVPSIDGPSISTPKIAPITFALPGKDKVLGAFDGISAGIDKLSDFAKAKGDLERSISKTAGEIAGDDFSTVDDLLSGPLPSEKAQAWIEAIRRSSEESASAIAAASPAAQVALGNVEKAAGGAAKKVKGIGKAAKAAASGTKKAFDVVKDQTNDVRDSFRAATSSMSSAFDQFVETGKFSFKGLVRSIAADITKITIKNAFTRGLGGGGLLGGLLGGIGSFFGVPGIGSIAGARAEGGPVRGGSTYLVGERGPELFTARNSGTIIPNDQVRAGGSGGGGVTFQENITLQPGVSRDELRVTLQELERIRDDKQRRMIQTGEGAFAGLVEA